MQKRAPEPRTKVVLGVVADLFRDMLESAVAGTPDLKVVGHATNVEGLREIVEAAAPCVLVVGPTLAAQIASSDPSGRLDSAQYAVLVLVAVTREPQNMASFARLGAAAVVPNDVHVEELIQAIRLLGRGMVLFPARAWGAMAPAPAPALPDDVRISPREQQILELWAEGASDKEVAMQLAISRRTVHTYAGNLKCKLGAVTRTHAVALAIAFGIVSLQNVVPQSTKGRPYP